MTSNEEHTRLIEMARESILRSRAMVEKWKEEKEKMERGDGVDG